MNYNRAVKIARVLSGRGLVEMADAIGVDKSLLSRIENGKREISMVLFDKISTELDIPRDIMLSLATPILELSPRSRYILGVHLVTLLITD